MLINTTRTIIHNGTGYSFDKRSKDVWQYALIRVYANGHAYATWSKTNKASLETLKAQDDAYWGSLTAAQIEAHEGTNIVASYVVQAFAMVPVKARKR